MKSTTNKILNIIDNKIEIYRTKQRFYESSGSSSIIYDRIIDELHDIKNQINAILKEEEDARSKKEKKTHDHA